MLKQPLPGRRRLRTGILLVAVLASACSYGAWALQPGNLVKAPAMLGVVVEDAVAVATVAIVGKDENVEVSGGAMAGRKDGLQTIFIKPYGPMHVSVGKGSGRWELTASASDGTIPTLSWTLSHAGKVVQQSQAPLQDGRPVTLQVGEDGSDATRLLVSVSLPPADKVMRGAEASTTTDQPQIDKDGAYLYANGGGWVGSPVTVNGDAVLLLTLDAEGKVRDVQIEQVEPVGAFGLDQARDLVKNNRYSPKIENGRAVPSRIRMPIQFGPDSPSPTPDADASIKHAPAPDYPTDPVVKGRIVIVPLVIDVAADGSVRQAQVENGGQESLFEKTAIAAAMKWKFNPAYKDGKPVDARLRVPVTFDGSTARKTNDAKGG